MVVEPIQDASERLACLDITTSFIVQAPAGSGKTELLTQRFLRLLATVKNPENIVAITFTRKAAGEMRERIIASLQNAKQPEPTQAHAQKTWQLAQQALKNNNQLGWQLLDNPNRLRILTLDSLALMLSQQMPITSGFGAKPDIVEDARSYYEAAVERFIMQNHNPELHAAIDRLLHNFDNQAERVKQMLMGLLAKREQWLTHIVPFLTDKNQLKLHLESSLLAINLDIVDQLLTAWPADLQAEWQALLLYSLSNQEEQDFPRELYQRFPQQLQACEAHLPFWKLLADLILTAQNTVRKTLTKKQGFPSKADAAAGEKEQRVIYKERGLAALGQLQDNPNLVLALTTLKHAPTLSFAEQTWQSLQDLVTLLPWLVAELNCIFQTTGKVDFNELTLGALRALGNSDQPTELAMKLDHQILHLLIDEFQDTSILQGELIKQMIAEWQPGDGRSLFVVGDPMQSIYRFRNAEVSLFLQAQQHGIGPIPLEVIRLSSNFRSQAAIIDWINPTFQAIFPATAQPSIGGVPYSHATAVRYDNPEATGVQFSATTSSAEEEAENLVEHIHRLKRQNPQHSIAVLVRTRHQLQQLLPELRQAGIPFQATEIDYLGDRREIQDLLVLTQALLHLGNRLAWLSLLRTPCFGFNLADCLAVAEFSTEDGFPGRVGERGVSACIWHCLASEKIDDLISDDARQRLQIIRPILNHALKHIRRCRLANWVQQTWQALGGKQSLQSLNEINNARRYFDCLAEHEDDYDESKFRQALQKLFAEDQQKHDNAVEVMTIHKSKGLEFDHVILPNINYGKPPQDSDLLLWSSMSFSSGDNGLLLGVLPRNKERCDIYQYLRYLHAQQLDQETARLFYVASTRAKQSLYLSTITKQQNARSGSFAKKLPDHLQNELITPCDTRPPHKLETSQIITASQRMPLSYFIETERPKSLPQIGCNETVSLQLPTNQSIAGTVMHLYLYELSQNMQLCWDNRRLNYELTRLGLAKRHLSHYAEQIQSDIENIRRDETARWILAEHPTAASEYPLSELTSKGIRQHIIDRTFVDETGTRWIIDYKTSSPTGTSTDAFMEAEMTHYSAQLKRYEKLFAHTDRQVRSGLYFTRLQLFKELI